MIAVCVLSAALIAAGCGNGETGRISDTSKNTRPAAETPSGVSVSPAAQPAPTFSPLTSDAAVPPTLQSDATLEYASFAEYVNAEQPDCESAFANYVVSETENAENSEASSPEIEPLGYEIADGRCVLRMSLLICEPEEECWIDFFCSSFEEAMRSLSSYDVLISVEPSSETECSLSIGFKIDNETGLLLPVPIEILETEEEEVEDALREAAEENLAEILADAFDCEEFYSFYKDQIENSISIITEASVENWDFQGTDSKCLISYTANFEKTCEATGLCTTPEAECAALETTANLLSDNPNISFSAQSLQGFKCRVQLTSDRTAALSLS